jgi:predicted Zn-dependent protease
MMVKRLLETAEKGVKLSLQRGAKQVQASAFLVEGGLTRFANSTIHQNLASKKGGVLIKVILEDNRIGFFGTSLMDRVEEAVDRAMKLARASNPNKEFKSLPEPEAWKPIEDSFNAETAECTPDERAERVKEAIKTAHAHSPYVRAVAGRLYTNAIHLAVTNSLGVSASTSLTEAGIKVTVISRRNGSEGFGTAEGYSRRVGDIDSESLAKEAAEKSVGSLNPSKVPLGSWEVILSPLAVGSLLRILSYTAFSARAYIEGRSFIRYHLGERIFDEKLTLRDNSRDPKSLYALPFDGEGVPKEALTLVDGGLVDEGSICHDSLTAGIENKRSTGHALPPFATRYPGRSMPMPINMILKPGDSSLEEMIEETRKGLYITTLHYVNPVKPSEAVLTGLTRDGTFLIERGEISRPVVDMRFTDSLLSALKDISLVGRETKTLVGSVTPPLKLKAFRFVGYTAY